MRPSRGRLDPRASARPPYTLVQPETQKEHSGDGSGFGVRRPVSQLNDWGQGKETMVQNVQESVSSTLN